MKKPTQFLLVGLAAAGLAGASASAQSVEPPPRAALSDVQSIYDAKDPSSAIDAYGRAVAASPGDFRAQRAFVRKMVEFGRPEMAESQARDVVSRDPGDGFSRAVIAYVETQRGDQIAALRDVVQAARTRPDEPFVQRTAAELLAWYDTRANPPAVDEGLASDLAAMRQDLSRRGEFLEDYKRALSTYSQIDETTSYESYAPAPSTTYVTTQYVYTDPFAGFYYDPWWSDPWTSYWGPPGIVVVRDFDRDDFRRRRFDRFERHDFDRGRFNERRDFGGSRTFVPQRTAPEQPRTFTPRREPQRVQPPAPRVQPRQPSPPLPPRRTR